MLKVLKRFAIFHLVAIKPIISLRKEEEMNKGDLVSEVAKVVSTKKEARAAVDCVFETIKKALKKKDAVTLIGFGTFKVEKRKARKGRNPQTGEALKIKAKRVAKFVPGKALKEAV
jgi:nucleoid DNA-binding protein